MGIVDRVQDAELPWEAGRREGALMSALVAFAATARRVRPEPVKDRDAFEGLFRDAVELDLDSFSALRRLYFWSCSGQGRSMLRWVRTARWVVVSRSSRRPWGV